MFVKGEWSGNKMGKKGKEGKGGESNIGVEAFVGSCTLLRFDSD